MATETPNPCCTVAGCNAPQGAHVQRGGGRGPYCYWHRYRPVQPPGGASDDRV